ncbi:hypothetical protein M426DRAFT_121151 [Hypoxylon sp. CI-4A]|nr:hypothetical protein M426DRAFT_121151 [Hypoxylon sp. CI-4A]
MSWLLPIRPTLSGLAARRSARSISQCRQFSATTMLQQSTKPRHHTIFQMPATSPIAPRLVLSQDMIQDVKAGMSKEDWHKSVYGYLLDEKLHTLIPDKHLQCLQQEEAWLLYRHQQIVWRQKVDLGCESALQMLEEYVTWRREVLSVRIAEMEAYKQGMKDGANEESSEKAHSAVKSSIWNWFSPKGRD